MENLLIRLTLKHAAVGRVSDGEDMRWDFMSLLTLVQLDDFLSVDGKALVWVDHDTEKAWVGLKWT